MSDGQSIPLSDRAADDGWPKLDKPARVGGTTFRPGVSAGLVVGAAQRAYEANAAEEPVTREQAIAAERVRRDLWDLLHGPLDAAEPTMQTKGRVLHWLENGDVGMSSKCMAMWLGFGVLTRERFCPADPDDLDRCLRLLEIAPGLRPLIPRMADVSERWARLVRRWDEVEASHLDEAGLGCEKAGRAPKTYALMAAIQRTD